MPEYIEIAMLRMLALISFNGLQFSFSSFYFCFMNLKYYKYPCTNYVKTLNECAGILF